MSAFLTADELHRLTGKRRYKAQCRMLVVLGVRFTKAASGEPIVRVDAVDEAGKPAHRRASGPRWDRIGNVAQIAALARPRRA